MVFKAAFLLVILLIQIRLQPFAEFDSDLGFLYPKMYSK
jgi:hypothetical protein